MNPGNRIVAVVGRPNVGKSSIFNRIAGERIAIVHEESGVTRDRLMRDVSWAGESLSLIDTGGICAMDGESVRDGIEAGIEKQVNAALADASAALLVVDAVQGLMPMDEEAFSSLRRRGIPVIVAVNKADTPEMDSEALEFERFGFPVFPVSALHNRGLKPLMKAVLRGLPQSGEKPSPDICRVAVTGRPNVGKSSYINRLLRSDRVIVSDVPGTTRDSVDIPFSVGPSENARQYLLIDTAGMRKRGRVSSRVEEFSRMRAGKSIERADIVVLVLDASQGVTAYDKRIATRILKEEKGCVILVNKWDLSELTQRKFGPELFRMMPFLAHCPVVFASAATGYNIRRTVEAIDHVAAAVRTQIPTAMLNSVIGDAQKKVQPQSVKGRRLKIFYAVQAGYAPLRFRLFVNSPRLVTEGYRKYLVKSLRERIGLEGAPVVLQFRARRKARYSNPK